jgi:predicted RNA methylase
MNEAKRNECMLDSLVVRLSDSVTIIHGDCRDVLPVECDAVVTDPPYGVTDHEWDTVVPAAAWMRAACCVATASEPFATVLIGQAPIPFRFDCVWVKNCCSNPMNAKRMPLRRHERVLVFGDYAWNPRKRERTADEMKRLNRKQRETMRFSTPDSVLEFDSVNCRSGERTSHPSQKPVELMQYLVETFTTGTVCDPFMGSGSTGIACIRTGRKFIGIEKDARYFEIARARLENELRQGLLPLTYNAKGRARREATLPAPPCSHFNDQPKDDE